jgi:hypothetical protein
MEDVVLREKNCALVAIANGNLQMSAAAGFFPEMLPLKNERNFKPQCAA